MRNNYRRTKCAYCRTDIEQPSTGRPRKFCCGTCRVYDWHRRHRNDAAKATN